jgi:8-oxo-dGTP pyrophosphatase MutT (NUDIX family)
MADVDIGAPTPASDGWASRAGDDGIGAWAGALQSGQVSVSAVTSGQPSCAGVLLIRQGRLLCSLSTENSSSPPGHRRWRVGGVGGGREPDEDIWQCTRREAQEELGCTVQLVSAPLTYLHDSDTGDVAPIRCSDAPAPFCLQRQRNADPTKPFRPGLPAGPYTYFALFLARPADGKHDRLSPGDDAGVLLWMPLARWRMLSEGPTLQAALAVGAGIIATRRVDRRAVLWLPSDESLTAVAPLLLAHPELETIL